MTSSRSVVMMVLIFVVTSVLVLLHAKDVMTLEYDDLLPATETNARQLVDTDISIGDHRQGRMSLQPELPSSKAKREQALRNILAARRRQILTQRPFETSRNFNRTPRPGASSFKDSSDILEAQETRHGMYVTAPASMKADSTIKDETSEDMAKILSKIVPTALSDDPVAEFVSKNPQDKQMVEQTSRKSGDQNLMASSIEGKPAFGNSRSNYSIGHKNSSSSPSTGTSSSFGASAQKISDAEDRKRNTVSMPESLYNYFRPVESNIPVEDMSQFLYFGQKIQPEAHNVTGNNSVDVTPTVPTSLSSRRRYSMKRFGVTTSIPMPRLEEIINEEMNIAVERQIVEKNKVSKIKNTFRSSENGLYYRKARPTDPTIASNVISMKESDRNSTEADARTESAGDKFRDDNPSAHAGTRDQLQRERGSAATHVLAETRNATNSTQIPYQQPVSANVDEESTVESEIGFKDRPTSITDESPTTLNAVGKTKLSKNHSRRRKIDNSSMVVEDGVSDVALKNIDRSEATDTEMHADQTEHRATKVDVSDRVARFDFSKKDTTQADRTRAPNSRESNNIETSSSRGKIGRSTTETPFLIPRGSPETSTLRIIVTEENIDQTSAINVDPEKNYTVKPVDSMAERVRTVPPGGIPTHPAITTLSTINTIDSKPPTIETTTVRSSNPHRYGEGNQDEDRYHHRRKGQRENPYEEQHHRHREQQQRQQQHQQQHVYAYTITNVTRLLRNYTGPGLSGEEQGGPRRSTGAAEITTGSPQQQRRQPPPPSPPPPPLLLPSLLLLPRTGSGIEADRAPAELSAGTTVEAVAADGVALAGNLVGERPRKVIAAAAPQSQQRAPSRTSSSLLPTVNKSGASNGQSSRPTEVTTRGAVRWNHTKARNADLEGTNDRRFLRKSASAVLNQRSGISVDDDGPVINKRRRVTNGLGIFGSGRRFKGQGLMRTAEGISGERSVNGSSMNGGKEYSANGEKVENAVEGRGIREDGHLGGTLNRDGESAIPVGTMGYDRTEETTNLSVISNSTGPPVDATTPRTLTDTMDEDESNLAEVVTSTSQNVADTKDNDTSVRGESESILGNKNATTNSSASGGDKSDDNGSGSSTVTVTETVEETIAAKETVPTATTMPTPVFPVTPKIITEAAQPPIEKETFTLKPTESASRVPETKTTEPDKPFGVANLDPSEIQKMYRSKNLTTTTTEASIDSTPMAQTTVPSNDETTIPNFKTNESETTIVAPVTDPPKRISGERSPEVRARNLSDKTKDKDDILPIMHLYNTSDIFNGTGTMDTFSRGTVSTELPLGPKRANPFGTIEKVDDTTTPKTSANDTSNSSRVPLPDPIRKDNKQDDNRVAPSQVPPTGPGRGSSFVNGSGNRARHRPVYHPTFLPDYNATAYPSELNRTFFDAGLISVSPRESVNISEVISKRHDGDAIASQETVAVVSYILATLVVFPIAVGVGLILRRLILRNRKVLEESDTSSEISCRKDALNLENGDFKTSIEKAITKLPRIQHLCHEAEKPPPPSSQESRWEFPRDKLRLQTVLGQGNFGQVWKAEADDLTGHQGTTRLVAVKTVKEGASDREKEDLVRELEIMQQLGSHPNVVTLLGCCTEEEPHYLILEYVMYGKLLAYLRDHRTRQDFYNFSEDSAALTSRDLTVFGYCVARGMEYLASKKIIHRDLAARNVLVDHNKLCKIADFGMSRFANEDGEVIETRHGRNALPIRWMAPESLIYSLFTTKTDVWSFGILMWEIVTLGSTPYPDMTAREVMRNVQNGYRLERPSHCRSELFRVISRCWHADPDRRPEFQTLRRDLAQLLEDNMNGHYVDLESFASECTD